jgi:hypothetical protein
LRAELARRHLLCTDDNPRFRVRPTGRFDAALVPDGLSFRDLLDALRDRQWHDVHRGTLRAVLCAGGFRIQDGRWRTGQDEQESGRSLREAVVLASGDPLPKSRSRPRPALASSRSQLPWRTAVGRCDLPCGGPTRTARSARPNEGRPAINRSASAGVASGIRGG